VHTGISLLCQLKLKDSKFYLSIHNLLNFSGVLIHIIKLYRVMNLTLSNKLYVEYTILKELKNF
jgi:hypothetical protein